VATFEITPKSTVPGTRPWAETVAANAKRYAAFTEKDVRPLVERYRALCDHEVWELFFPGQIEAKERFCRELLGYEAEFLETMSKGVEILDGRGHEGQVPAQLAEYVALRERAGRPSNADRNTNNISISGERSVGTGRTYTVRRLRRDRPDLAGRVDRGELSANAAAIQAGFRNRTITVPIARPDAVARSLLKYMTPDDIAQLIAALLGKET
jgi:hypothetical protein